jgi:hypothetical protein
MTEYVDYTTSHTYFVGVLVANNAITPDQPDLSTVYKCSNGLTTVCLLA